MTATLRNRPAWLYAGVFLYMLRGVSGVCGPLDITVMTQNLYIGADTTPVLLSPTFETAAAAFDSVVANNFLARAGAIANEAASAGGPLLIGLQEAFIISGPTGTLDYAQILLNQLAARGLNYTIAGVHTGLSIAVAGFSATDREVVLARTDAPGFTVTSSQDYTFQNNVTVPTALGNLSLQRGDVLVNATLDGVPFQFVSTHLDEFHTPLQPLQAGEILSQLSPSSIPQLVVGDFNSSPSESTYSVMLAAGFTDTAAITGAVGATCCQAADLSNTVSQLTHRFDYVFERNFSSIDAAFLVGDTPFENVRPLWPSDHAGVIATVDVPEPPAGMVLLTALLLLGFRQFRILSRGGSGRAPTK
jgi:endonuclease/exonuclease/phosphatase family metal-dependent hydrolase